MEALESGLCAVIKMRLKGLKEKKNKIEAPPKIGNPTFKIGRSTAVLIFSGRTKASFFLITRYENEKLNPNENRKHDKKN